MKDESEKISMYEKELFYFLFCKPAKSAFLKKNNIFAFINIAKVSSCGDFNEFCLFFAGSVTV